MKAIFSPDQFTATQWDSAEAKAKFANHLMHFLNSECKETLFTHAFYNRLSMCFGHIAHFNRPTFYQTWFQNSTQRLAFLKHALAYPCWGDPKFTYSDVERAIRLRIRQSSFIDHYELLVETELRTREVAQLERLQRKYGANKEVLAGETQTLSVPSHALHLIYPTLAGALLSTKAAAPLQISLF